MSKNQQSTNRSTKDTGTTSSPAVTVSPVTENSQNPNRLVELAITQGANVDALERVFALQEKWEANQAKKAFTQQMAELQSELPVVKKMKANGGTNSNYAPLEDIVAQCKDVIKKHDFMYSWDTTTDETKLSVICKVTHLGGHTETSSMVSEIAEGTRANSSPQKAAITITYLKRYTLCNAFGIMVADEDQDARLEKSKPKLPANPKAKIMALLKALNVDTSDGEVIKEEVKKLTGEELVEASFEEIISKLTVIWQERNENQNAN